MLSAIFNALPDWAVSIILGGLAWFALNYVWLGPTYFQKLAAHQKAGCVASEAHGDLRMDTALYTATLGIMGSEFALMQKICGGRS